MASPAPHAAGACTNLHAIDISFAHFAWGQIAVLGIVQGITELLPISSTAHLRVIPALLGWQDPGSAFSAAMQLASLLAVVVYFWRDIVRLLASGVDSIRRRDLSASDSRMLLGIIIGTIPIGICGLLLRFVLNACHSPMRSLTVIGIACIVMSLLLALAERYARHTRKFGELTLRDGIWVGLAQAFALVPGVSRSGATLTAALYCGMERETAARFSFLLGLPAIVLAGGLEMYELLKAGLSSAGWQTLLVGLAVASVTAFLAIYWLLHYLEKRTTWIFVWYRLALGIVLLAGVGFGFLH